MMSTHLFLVTALHFYHIAGKTVSQYLIMILLVLMGINCYFEGISLFFAISLNMTTRELYFTNTYPYFVPVKHLDQFEDYRYMTEQDRLYVNPSNSGNFKKYRKSKNIFLPFYRNFVKNWWDVTLRNCRKKPTHSKSPFFKRLLDSEKVKLIEDSSFITMDNSPHSLSEKTKSSSEDFNQSESSNSNSNPEVENTDSYHEEDFIKEDKNEQKEDQVCQKEITEMLDSFKFLEGLAVDYTKEYSNSAEEPLMSIFNLHCPQREKSLMMCYRKIQKKRSKLIKVQESDSSSSD